MVWCLQWMLLLQGGDDAYTALQTFFFYINFQISMFFRCLQSTSNLFFTSTAPLCIARSTSHFDVFHRPIHCISPLHRTLLPWNIFLIRVVVLQKGSCSCDTLSLWNTKQRMRNADKYLQATIKGSCNSDRLCLWNTKYRIRNAKNTCKRPSRDLAIVIHRVFESWVVIAFSSSSTVPEIIFCIQILQNYF